MPNRSGLERTIASALKLMLPVRLEENVAALPGTPDIVARRVGLAVFVNGCYWHSHACTRGKKRLGRNELLWIAKLGRTVVRDQLATVALESSGWTVVTLWECDIRLDLRRELTRVKAEFDRLNFRQSETPHKMKQPI